MMFALWMPVLVSAVSVFVASSLIHMLFKWHNADYRQLANEEEVRAAIRKTQPAPGQYLLPYCGDMKQLGTPEFQQKFVEGPVGMLLLRRNGLPRMGANLGQWFGLTLVVAVLTAAVAASGLAPGADPHRVFHVCALVTLLAYGAGAVSDGIWKGEPWRAVAKDLLDALIYAVVTGAAFMWLWPH